MRITPNVSPVGSSLYVQLIKSKDAHLKGGSEMKRKKLISAAGISGVIVGLLFFATAAVAQGWGYGMMGGYRMGHGSMMNGHSMMGPGMMCGGMMNGMMGSWQNLPQKYQLSPEQQRALNDIRSEYQTRVWPLMRDLRSTRMELQAYEARPQAEPQRIREYREEILRLEKKIDDYGLEAREKMNKVLTEEQRAYWSANEWLSGEDRCPMMSGGSMMGWSHTPGAMMNY